MFCSNCGNEMTEGSAFCEKCGQRIEEVSVAENVETVVAQMPVMPVKPEKKRSKGWLMWILIILVLIAGVVGILFFVESQKKMVVDLTGIVSFEVNGYSGYAKASVSVNQEALEEKYKDELYEHAEVKIASFIKRTDLLDYEVTSLDGLSNGDKIVLSWKSDVEKALEEYKVNVICTDVEYIVTGLPEIKMINPFDMLNVAYYGISGEADAIVTIDGNAPAYMDYFPYFLEEGNGWYSNGDIVTISFDNSAKDMVAAEYGIRLSEFQRNYQVSGLPEYISNSEQMTLERLKPLMLDSEKYFKSYMESEWSDAASIKNLKCMGYFISKADYNGSSIRNAVGLIYEVTANLYYEGRSEDFVYYYPVVFPNVLLNTSGSISYNANELYTAQDSFEHGFTAGVESNADVSEQTWIYYGYETKEELLADYSSYSLGWDDLTTIELEEADYTEMADGYKAEEREKKKEEIMNAGTSELGKYAADIFLETTTGWSEAVNINSIKCVETVYYTGEILSDAFADNIYAVILEVNVSMEYSDMKEDFTYYYPIRFWDGRQNHTECLHTFDKMLGNREIWEAWQVGPSNVWRFNGYETLDEIHAENEELRHNHVYYNGEVLPSTLDTEETTGILTEEWLNADANEIIQIAEETFLSTTEEWLETASINSIEVEETFIGAPNIPKGEDGVSTLFGILLKINANVVYDDMTENFDYYYCVMYDNAMVKDDGTVWVDVDTQKVPAVEFKKMLGNKEIWEAWEMYPSNVWIFEGYPTLEIAHNDIATIKYNHLKYATERISKETTEE